MSPKKLRIDHPLDEQYQALYEMVLAVAEGYLAHANWLIARSGDRDLHTHLLISVRIRTPGCWSATWAKKVDIKDTSLSRAVGAKLRPTGLATAGRSVTIDLPKGAGFSYKPSTFKSLPKEVREAAMHHERLLADLRKAAHENRALCRTMNNSIARSKKALEACEAALSAGESLREAFS